MISFLTSNREIRVENNIGIKIATLPRTSHAVKQQLTRGKRKCKYQYCIRLVLEKENGILNMKTGRSNCDIISTSAV